MGAFLLSFFPIFYGIFLLIKAGSSAAPHEFGVTILVAPFVGASANSFHLLVVGIGVLPPGLGTATISSS